MKTHENVILITNTRTQYSAHNLVYLALPNGLTYGFRYKKKHLEYIYSLQVPDKERFLLGKKGLLVLRDIDTAKFIPLRSFVIQRAVERGDAMYLDLQFFGLAKYEIGYKRNISVSDAAIGELKFQYSDLVCKTLPAPHKNIPGEVLSTNLVYTTSHSVDQVTLADGVDLRSELQYWSNLAYLLSTLEDYYGKCFYRITGIQKMESAFRFFESSSGCFASLIEKTRTLRAKKLRDSRYGFVLVGNRNYMLEAVQETPQGYAKTDEPTSLSVRSNPQQLIFMESSVTVDSDFDLLKFIFSTLPQETTPTSSYISVPIASASSGGGENSLTQLLSARLPLSIRWSFRSFLFRKVMPPAAFVMAIFLWLAAEGLGADPSGLLFKLGFSEEAIRYVAIFLMALAFQSWSSFVRIFKVES